MANPDFDDDKTQSFVALTADTRVSHYEIIDKIGADEIGEVYLAEDTSLDREVAPKFFPAPSTLDHDFMSRFVREAEAAPYIGSLRLNTSERHCSTMTGLEM